MVKAPSLFLNRTTGVSSGGGGGSATAGNTLPTRTSSSTSSYYQKKYKPWRKGKSTKHASGSNSSTDGGSGRSSANSNHHSHGSLKQQLRGLLRLQQQKKKMKDLSNNCSRCSDGNILIEQPPDLHQQQQEIELQERIDALQEQIVSRTVSEKERNNATKSHKLRFIDRQRTTRLYQQYMKQLSKESDDDDDDELLQQQQQTRSKKIHDELYKLALDQIYIAHYPLDRTSYVSIFNNNNNNNTTNTNAPTETSATGFSLDTNSTSLQPPPQRRTIMNNRLLHKISTQRQCTIERLHQARNIQHGAGSVLDSSHNINNNDNSNHDDIDTHRSSANNPKLRSETRDSSNLNRTSIKHASWIHPSQYERIHHLMTWSTHLERSTFNITLVDGSNSSSNNSNKTDCHQEDERFNTNGTTGTASFNPTQQLLLQEQDRMEREMLREEEEKEKSESSEANENQQLATGNKSIDTNTKTYSNDGSDTSNDSGEDDDDAAGDDDADPLQSIVETTSSVSLVPSNDMKHDMNDATSVVDDNKNSNDDDGDDDDSSSSDESASGSINVDMRQNDNDTIRATSSQNEVIATATSLRKLASQKGPAMNRNTMTTAIDDDDDFFVSIDDNDDDSNKNSDRTTTSNTMNNNVFANAKRDTQQRYQNNNSSTHQHQYGIGGDKSQGWATQKQLPGQYRKKQRRR